MFAARAAFTGAKYAEGLAGICGVLPRSVSPTAERVKLVIAGSVVVVGASVEVVVDVVVVLAVGRVLR